MKYDHQKLEKKWQKFWEKNQPYKAKDFDEKPKYYSLVEFPYPSSDGLHVGHVRGYSALDTVSRYKRMNGFNVLYPIGFDAFGLPTENFAIKNKIHPKVATNQNIRNFTRQLKSLGLSFDWSRTVNTTDPKYYKWTQWIFLKLFKAGMAYRAETLVNWCPQCRVGLSNEEVVGGQHERCQCDVVKKPLKQWIIKITDYADRLINDLDKVDYPQRVKTQQINWIGKSLGTELVFKVKDSDLTIPVFTTRADTIFGATYLVIAPDHMLVQELKSSAENLKEVEEYIQKSLNKSERERMIDEKEKSGVELKGLMAINPANGKEMPIWIADYVLMNYGTGAVMAVPAHDERDYSFAKKFNLAIVKVIIPPPLGSMVRNAEDLAAGADMSLRIVSDLYTGEGLLTNSGKYEGLSSIEARKKITKDIGKEDTHYKLRDWIFSRQRYWGEPIPIIHCETCGEVPVPEKDLPVILPDLDNYQTTKDGESPLAKIDSFVNVKCPKCEGPAKRETDTMPNWAGSNWYFIRYTDPQNENDFASKDNLDYWMPVDLYNGGMEHTTLHLLYSRFIYKFLYDQKLVPQDEPYAKRTSHGIILANDGRKMSKSFGNVVNPDDIVERHGADALRMYEMFIAPFEYTVPWDERGVVGVKRFLNRFYEFVLKNSSQNESKSSNEEKNTINQLVKKITDDIEDMKFNTAISMFMKTLNILEGLPFISKETLEIFLIVLAPFAPHIAEELWSQLGNKDSIHNQKWPKSETIKNKEFKLIIQVNGKTRDIVSAQSGISEKEATDLATSSEKIKKYLTGKKVKKIIFVPNKLTNIVI